MMAGVKGPRCYYRFDISHDGCLDRLMVDLVMDRAVVTACFRARATNKHFTMSADHPREGQLPEVLVCPLWRW